MANNRMQWSRRSGRFEINASRAGPLMRNVIAIEECPGGSTTDESVRDHHELCLVRSVDFIAGRFLLRQGCIDAPLSATQAGSGIRSL